MIKNNILDLQQKCDRYKKQHLKSLQLQLTNKSANHQSVQTEEVCAFFFFHIYILNFKGKCIRYAART